jgi:hypothetical protein
MSSLTPLSLPPTRRRLQQPQAVRDEMDSRNVQNGQNSNSPVERAKQAIPPTTDARALASRITEAGQRRRGEIPESGTGLTHPVAKAIVRAGRVRRGEEPVADVLPSNPIALAIILSGRKARGTIDAAGEQFLSDFVGKFEAAQGLPR